MTPLPIGFCAACGLALLTMAEVEAHKVHALPVEHIHVEVDGHQPLNQIDLISAASGSGVSRTAPPLMSWGANGLANDVAVRGRSRLLGGLRLESGLDLVRHHLGSEGRRGRYTASKFRNPDQQSQEPAAGRAARST